MSSPPKGQYVSEVGVSDSEEVSDSANAIQLLSLLGIVLVCHAITFINLFIQLIKVLVSTLCVFKYLFTSNFGDTFENSLFSGT